MGMYRIVCTKCKYTTNVHRYSLDCVRQVEADWYITHVSQRGLSDPQAHDDAFLLCPVCGHKYKIVYRFFPQEQIDEIKKDREDKMQKLKARMDADPAFQEAQRQAYYAQSMGALVYKLFPTTHKEVNNG